MPKENNVEDIISSESLGFSNILRKAREQKGISLADVGSELHLDESIIYAIENNNLDDLPEPAYICGYIRNYARFMSLDPAPLVENFKEISKIEPKLSSVSAVSRKLERKEEKRSVFFLLFLVILLFLGVFFGWQLWQGKVPDLFSLEKFEKSDSASLLLSQPELSKQELNEPELLNQSQLTNNISTDEDKAGMALVKEVEIKQLIKKETDDNVDNSEVDNKIANSTELELVEADTANNSNNVVDSIENRVLLPSTSVDPIEKIEIVNAEVIEKKLISNKKELQFKFSKNSWISVKDGNTKSLIYDLVHKGEVITLYGKAPVNIFLGDGTGVELSVNGQSYNFASYINSKKIAKFVVE